MKYLFLILVFGALAACSSSGFKRQKPEDYLDTNPKFIIEKQLGGELVTEGVIFGPNGKISQRYVAKMKGDWANGKGTLAEDFVFSNGTKQTREWKITMGANGRFTATAGDVVGTATGHVSGATLQMKYKLKLTEDAGGHVLDVVDWIYLVDDGTMINKSEMRKFGFKVAELVGTIRPVK